MIDGIFIFLKLFSAIHFILLWQTPPQKDLQYYMGFAISFQNKMLNFKFK